MNWNSLYIHIFLLSSHGDKNGICRFISYVELTAKEPHPSPASQEFNREVETQLQGYRNPSVQQEPIERMNVGVSYVNNINLLTVFWGENI